MILFNQERIVSNPALCVDFICLNQNKIATQCFSFTTPIFISPCDINVRLHWGRARICQQAWSFVCFIASGNSAPCSARRLTDTI